MSLIERETRLIECTEDYLRIADAYQQAEEEYKIIRAKAMNSRVVSSLPNQAMREAKLDVVLQEDERFKGKYLEFKSLEGRKRQAYYMLELMKELVKNARIMYVK